LPVRRTLEKIGIPLATFYHWYDLYQAGGPEALDDRHPQPMTQGKIERWHQTLKNRILLENYLPGDLEAVLGLDDTVTRSTLSVVRSQLDETLAREARPGRTR
jgi:hypothetical protein